MEVRLLDFHCIINFNDVILGCGTYSITDERAICHDLQNTIYIALINQEDKDVNK
jgi:hypothetical protein